MGLAHATARERDEDRLVETHVLSASPRGAHEKVNRHFPNIGRVISKFIPDVPFLKELFLFQIWQHTDKPSRIVPSTGQIHRIAGTRFQIGWRERTERVLKSGDRQPNLFQVATA